MIIAAVGCADTDRDAADVAIDVGQDQGDVYASDLDRELGNSTDEEIASKAGAIMITIDDGEMFLVDHVLATSTDPIVLDFADSMLIAHHEHLIATGDLMIELGISPIENPISHALTLEAERTLREIQVSADPDFDFMHAQVKTHTESLVIVDTLLRFAPYLEMQLFFDDALGMISDHRSEAVLILRGF